MKKLSITLALILFVAIFAACSSSPKVTTDPTPTEVVEAEAPSDEIVLEIIGLEKRKTLNMTDLRVMPTT